MTPIIQKGTENRPPTTALPKPLPTHRVSPPMPLAPSPAAPHTATTPSLRWTYGLWVVLVAVVAFQPNFRWTDTTRTAPYGSDYLQEWVAGRILLDGRSASLYDGELAARMQADRNVVGYELTTDARYPMVYPPYWYIITAPLSAIPLRWAALLWLTVTTAVWFFGLRWAATADTRLGHTFARTPQLALLSAPLLFSLSMGQKAALVALIITATFVLLQQERLRTAGAVCALLAFKPHFALLLGVPLAIRFGLPFITGCLATGAALIGLVWIVDASLLGDYVVVATSGIGGDYLSTAGYHIEDAHNWGGFWSRLLGPGETAIAITRVWSVATVVLVCLAAFRRRSTDITAADATTLTIGLVLASPHFYGYDLAVLLVPIWWTLRQYDAKPSTVITGGIAAWWALTMLPHASKFEALPIQWSVVILAVVFAGSVAASFGVRWPTKSAEAANLRHAAN